MIDGCGRSIDYVRISVTDRCNLRCVYCMPYGGVKSLSHADILTFEEIERCVRALARLGVRHVRVTGGEPMVRANCLELIARINAIEGIETIAMTTNGLLLKDRVRAACAAGLDSLNVSLDTLDAQRYAQITRGGRVQDVISVIDDAQALGMRVKVNAVPVRGLNDGDLVDLARLAKDRPIHVRFIELMPVGCGASLSPIPSQEVLGMMREAFGALDEDDVKHGFGPARYVRPAGFSGSIGVISPISHEFCDQCNRVRLTADGYFKLCLNHRAGLDVRALLRGGAGEEELAAALSQAIMQKPKRHGFDGEAEDREVKRMNEIGG